MSFTLDIPANHRDFNKFGRDWKAGKYKKLSPKSREYAKLWQRELERCLNGYSVGGRYISGELYSYINFGTILIYNERTGSKRIGLPDFRDIDYTLDKEKRAAEKEGKGFMYISGRRLGKSFSGAWDILYTAIFQRDHAAIGCGIEDKGIELLDKVEQHWKGLRNTEFFVPILSTHEGNQIRWKFGYEQKDLNTNEWEEVTTGGVIHFCNFNKKTTASNGLSTKKFVFEEIGMFDNLINASNDSEPCWRRGSKNFGTPIYQGTGGDMERGSIQARAMFNDPETYNLKVYEDPDNPNKKTGYFIPGWVSYEDYRDPETGKLDKEAAIEKLDQEREIKQKGKNPSALHKHMQYYPKNYHEAFLESGRKYFPNAEIQQQIQRISTNPHYRELGHKGFLYRDSSTGKVKFKLDEEAQEVSWPVNAEDDNTGCVVIYEHPKIDPNTDEPIQNLYALGTDPYVEDITVSSPSLGSTMVYKRTHNPAQEVCEWPVAEYTGRPPTTDEYNHQSLLLCEYYGQYGGNLHENNVKSYKTFFDINGGTKWLAPQPIILKDILQESRVQRKYGVTMSKPLKINILNRIRDWLLTKDENELGQYNLNKIYSIELLRELLNYSDDGNFDRVIAFGLALLKAQEDIQLIPSTEIPHYDVDPFFENFEKRHFA